MSEPQAKPTGIELLEAFNEAAAILELTEQEQKSVLGFEPNSDVAVSKMLAESRDAQARARSIIRISESLTELSQRPADEETPQRRVSELADSYFYGSHDNMVKFLSENYDHSERQSQIDFVLRLGR